MAVCFCLLIILAVVPIAKSNEAHPLQTSAFSVRQKIVVAFRSVLDAQKAGGNVTSLVASLNSALDLVDQAESASDPGTREQLLAKADRTLDDVIASAPHAREQGQRIQTNNTMSLGLWWAVIGLLGLAVYRYGPGMFWKVWLKTHGRWRVRRR